VGGWVCLPYLMCFVLPGCQFLSEALTPAVHSTIGQLSIGNTFLQGVKVEVGVVVQRWGWGALGVTAVVRCCCSYGRIRKHTAALYHTHFETVYTGMFVEHGLL